MWAAPTGTERSVHGGHVGAAFNIGLLRAPLELTLLGTGFFGALTRAEPRDGEQRSSDYTVVRRTRRSLLAVCGFAVAIGVAGCGFLPLSKMSFVGTEILEAAPKPPPVDTAFEGCGEAGSQPDYSLNRLKNRVDDGKFLPTAWKVIARLPWPRRVGYRFRNQWTTGETREVKRFEGAPVEVEGYLVGFKLELPEPPNCYSTGARQKDYHLWLSEHANDTQRNSIVVELTPRVRVSHPGWEEDKLAAMVNTQVHLRIRGWLMLDQMHPENVGRNRTTLWEVHPIMQLEWRSSRGKWISLDSLSPSSDTVRTPER